MNTWTKENNSHFEIERTPSNPAHKAYMGIRQMLFNNEIVPGQKIAYHDLAERLNMSSTPVVQALKWLEIQGIVRHMPNRGYYTETVSLQEVEEIYDSRITIECSLLAKAIENMDRDGELRLEASLIAHRSSRREPYLNDWLLKDMEYHMILASLSGSTIQKNILRHLFDLLYLKYRGSILFLTTRPNEAVFSEHQAIYDSVLSGDLKKATEAITDHITKVKGHVVMVLSQMMGEKEKTEF